MSGHTQRDEISRLFHREAGTFDRKYDSILADKASASSLCSSVIRRVLTAVSLSSWSK
ncbi:MAG: hypothetical protein AVDCRST_MAG28-817 [uncultured Rubrobacteraceae bacterium]|uniref:Uncharacterized protein n=1 Tax=uncultured Rubrobacteraceae bacterium TaxID=349277 RepID=A0A6J4QHA3_9ACTN|nr:MAG: hypothetical protein AVDCRST_MAG28-817 [uncultured Rubrobacteraceae bacterium]